MEAFADRIRLQLFLRGLVVVSGMALVLAITSFALDRWLRLSAPVRFILLLVGAAWLLIQAWRRIVRPVDGNWDPLDVAASLDRALHRGNERPFLTQRVATILQLRKRLADGDGGGDSPALLRAAVARGEQELDAFEYRGLLDRVAAAQRVLALVALTLIPVAAAVFAPDETGLWFKRWFLGSSERWPQQTYLVLAGVEGNRIIVPRGEPYELEVSARAGSVVPEFVSLRFELDDGPEEQGTMNRYAKNDFRYKIPGVRHSARVWISGGDDRLGPITLEARARPWIESFSLEAHLPQADSTETFEFRTQDRDLAFRAQTRMRLVCHANQAVETVELPDEQREGVRIEKLGDATVVLTWTHVRRAVFTLETVSSETGLRSRPQSLSFGLREDLPPRVTLTVDGVRDRITPTATVPLRILARDDYGVATAVLGVASGESPKPENADGLTATVLHQSVSDAVDTSIEKAHAVEVGALQVAPGSFVHLSGSATDRCHLGPQTGRARNRALRVVEPDILFREISVRLQRSRGRFRQSRDDAKALGDLLSSSPVESAAEILRRHRLVERQAWSTQRVFTASLHELRLNRLIEAEAERMLERKVLRPLEVLHDQRLRDQRGDLERVSGGDAGVETAVLLDRQRRIVRDMDAILQAMKEWDSFVDLINQLNEIITGQEGVRGETLDATEETTDGGKTKDK